MLRSIAKRITKWFGWHRDTFVEEGDNQASCTDGLRRMAL
jgi:hypothetical protein